MLSISRRKLYMGAFTVLAYFTLFTGVFLLSIGLYNAEALQIDKKGILIACMMIIVAVSSIITQKAVLNNAEDNNFIEAQEKA